MKVQKTVHLNLIRYVTSAIFMYIVLAPCLLVPGWIGPRISPFACDDYSIRNPFVKETFSATAAFIITLFVPLLIIIVTEIFISRHSGSDTVFKFRRFELPALLVHIVAFEGYFQLGYVMQAMVNQVTKYSVGRLRPHFLTVCKPSPYNCTGGEIVFDYTCTGDAKHVKEGRVSFYSGHSSISMYTATFLAIYLHARIGHIAPRIILSTIQTLLFTGALMICYTRLKDYYHYPTDVATGALIGIIGAIYSCWAWADLWNPRGSYSPVHGKLEDDEEELQPTSVKVTPAMTIPEITGTEKAFSPQPDQLHPLVAGTERL